MKYKTVKHLWKTMKQRICYFYLHIKYYSPVQNFTSCHNMWRKDFRTYQHPKHFIIHPHHKFECCSFLAIFNLTFRHDFLWCSPKNCHAFSTFRKKSPKGKKSFTFWFRGYFLLYYFSIFSKQYFYTVCGALPQN